MINLKALTTLIIVSSFASVSFAGGDDLVKTWKNKQEAYYNGETLVEKNSLEAIQRMGSLLKKYKWPKAKKVSMLHKLADLHLNTGRILENKAGSSKANSHTLKALTMYKNIISKYPNYSKIEYVLFSRGFELFMRKNFEQAQEVLSILNRRFPRSKFTDDSYVIRADSLFELKRYTSATRLYSTAQNSSDRELATYSKYRKSWSLFNLKKYNQAYTSLYSIAKNDLKRKTDKLYSRGEALEDLPRFYHKQTLTSAYYRDFSVVADRAKTESLLSELSEMYFDQGEWSKSIGVYTDLVSRYPKSKMKSVYFLKKGIALSTKKRITRSSIEIKKGLTLCDIKLCNSIAQDDIFKLVNDWEKHWRENKKNKEYASALSTVYPSLAESTKNKIEKSKIYLLFAEVEYNSKKFKSASYAFEKAHIENPKAAYTRQARWGALESLMNITKKKWANVEIKRLGRLTNSFIESYSKEKDAIIAQNFLAKIYQNSNKSALASELFKRISEDHMYTKLGSEAYNSYLKIKIKEGKYKTTTDYLLSQRTRDKKGIKRTLINQDLDQAYTEWAEKLVARKRSNDLVKVYTLALENRVNSPLKRDWQWNKSLALVSAKSYKKAAENFMLYERMYRNIDGKRLEAFNNALVSYKKVKMYDEALIASSQLYRFDQKNQNEWLLEKVNLHMAKKNYLTAFEVLSQVDRNHSSKNTTFVSILSKLNEEELDKVTRSNLTSFSGDSVGELLLKLITKINDLDSQATKTVALRLKNLKLEDSNYNAKGNYTLAVHEFRKFKKIKFTINSRLEKSLEKMIKKMLKIDAYYRDAISQSTDETQAKSMIGLGVLYLQVAENYTPYAKKRIKSKLDITDVKDLISPFVEQSKVFWTEANSSIASLKDKKKASKLKNVLKKSMKRTQRLEAWYKKSVQIKIAANKGVR